MTVAHFWLVSRWSIDLDVIFAISGDLCHALTIDKWVGSFFHKRNLHGKKVSNRILFVCHYSQP
jgi:hypothetical protein